jgi:flagellar biosynthesis protein FlhG
VDLDLGGSNLHSYLGLENNLPAIGDFLKNKDAEFADYLHATRQSGLRFLPGDGRTPFLANMSHAHKIKLIRRLHQIEADYVLLDLGAGSTFNTLDHFSLAAHGLLVTNNEKTALMGMMVFVKNFLFRVISRSLKEFPKGLIVWNELLADQLDQKKLAMSSIIERVGEDDSEAAEEMTRLTGFYRPRVILNAGTHPDDLDRKLSNATGAMRSLLSIESEHFGFVFADPAVSESIEAGQSLMDYAPDSLAAKSLSAIAGRISTIWDQEIRNSEDRLSQNTKNIFRSLWTEDD